MSLSLDFRGFASCVVQMGNSVCFWEDIWNFGMLKFQYPQLFSFARDHRISVVTFLVRSVAENIHFPLSIIASQQLTQLEDQLHTLLINSDSNQCSYIWGISFTSKKHAYKALMGSFQKLKPHQWLQKSSCRGKHKFFFWLLMLDRLNTRNLLKRKNMFLPSYSCVLCNGDVEETAEHLFFGCPFSDRCWRLVDINWDLSIPFPDRMRIAKASFGNPRIFMEITLVAAWCIWSVRNGIIFYGATLSCGGGSVSFERSFLLLCLGVSPQRNLLLRTGFLFFSLFCTA